MGLRCEVCDEWLPVFQISKLCPICYQIRSVVKCYSNIQILEKLQESFLIDGQVSKEFKKPESYKSINDSKTKPSNDLLDYDKPITRNDKPKK